MVQKHILISIVIPVYNAEQYIRNCIDSILNQTYSFLELLIVNDGSKDSSLKICYEYAQKDSRIIVIDKENGGVSSARNKGIEHALGDYVAFVDADDYLKPTMIERMVKSAISENAELIFCGFEVLGSNLIFNDTETLIQLKDCASKENVIRRIIATDKFRLFGYIWRNLFKRSVLLRYKILFAQNIKISEDFMFLLNFAFRVSRISIVPEELYIYRVNNTSVTAKYMPTLHCDMLYINKWMYKEICRWYPSTLQGYHCCAANTYLRFIQNLCRKGSPYSFIKRITEAYRIKKIYHYKKSLKEAMKSWDSISNKNRISYLMLSFNFDYIYILLFSCKLHNF